MKKLLMIIGLVLVSGLAYGAETYTAVDNTLVIDGTEYTLTEINDELTELRAEKVPYVTKRTGLTLRISHLTDIKAEVNEEIDDIVEKIDKLLEYKTAATELNLTKVKSTVAIASLYE